MSFFARFHRSPVLLLPLALLGCEPGAGGGGEDGGVAVLGDGTHDLANIELTVIATADDGLDIPRDLEFHPDRDGELWIVNRGNNSTTILFGAGTSDQEALTRGDTFGSQHFLAQPSAIAFGDNGLFATIHEEDELTQGPVSQGGTPRDFMGPTLWTSDLEIYDGGHAGHMDMLHNSPNGMGIAWEEENTYWVFDGWNSAVTRYAFNDDHGPGGAFHGDAVVERCVEGEVDRDSDIPSHLVYDHASDYLYIADTGNGRVAVLDTKTGTEGPNIQPNYDGGEQYAIEDAEIWTLVDGGEVNLRKPSGIALRDDLLFVSDHRGSVVFAFDLEGNMVDWLDLDRGEDSITGLEFDADGNLWVVDTAAEEILRISTK